MIFKTSESDIIVNIATDGLAAIKLSGGLDSAVILSLMCMHIIEENPRAAIVPMTANWSARPYNYDFSNRVVEFARKRFGQVKILDTVKYDIPADKDYGDNQKQLIVIASKLHPGLTNKFTGETKNPPLDVIKSFNLSGDYPTHRDIDDAPLTFKLSSGIIEETPLARVTKRAVYELMYTYDLMELENIAWSCGSRANTTNNFTTPCGTCWPCQERNWGREILKTL
jgi:hypothetical protein